MKLSKNIKENVTVSLLVYLVLSITTAFWGNAFLSLVVRVKYYAFAIYRSPEAISILVGAILALLYLLFVKIKLRELTFKAYIITCFLFITGASLMWFTYLDHGNKWRYNYDFENGTAKFYFGGFITKKEDGVYSQKNVFVNELESGFDRGFGDNTLKVNTILSKIELKSEDSLKSVYLERLKASETLFNYYGIKQAPLRKLFEDYYLTKTPLYWVEVNDNGDVLTINSLVGFPLFFKDVDLQEKFDLTNKIHRFENLDINDKFFRGFYLGKFFRAIIEQSGVGSAINNKDYDSALAMIKNSEDEFLALDSFLNKTAETLDNDSAQKLKEYAQEDLNTWIFYTNYLRADVYLAQENYPKTEEYLKKMFDHGLYLNNISDTSFIHAFQNNYFYDMADLPKEDVKRLITTTGMPFYGQGEMNNALGLGAIIDYASSNSNFDFDSFFVWLRNKYPHSPVVLMYWAKVYTGNSMFLSGARVYKQALAMLPDSPILNILYNVALFNNAISNNKSPDPKLGTILEEFEKSIKSAELGPN